MSDTPDDGYRKGCTCGLIGPAALDVNSHLDHCALRGNPLRHLDVKLSASTPINRDMLDLKLTINFVVYDPEELETTVPEKHRAFLTDWLMRHTAMVSMLHGIDGLTMVKASSPREAIDYTVDHMRHALSQEIYKAMKGPVKQQLDASPNVARWVGSQRVRSWSRSRFDIAQQLRNEAASNVGEDVARQLNEEADLLDDHDTTYPRPDSL